MHVLVIFGAAIHSAIFELLLSHTGIALVIFVYCCVCYAAPLIKRRKVGRPKKKAKITMKVKDMKMTAVPGRRRGRPRKVWKT